VQAHVCWGVKPSIKKRQQLLDAISDEVHTVSNGSVIVTAQSHDGGDSKLREGKSRPVTTEQVAQASTAEHTKDWNNVSAPFDDKVGARLMEAESVW
jgi:hypothetical protein